jgi:plastocyanin
MKFARQFAAVFGLMAGSIAAHAQSTVSGQVAVLEVPGAKANDLANAVIWLESASSSAAPVGDTPIVMESRTFTPRVRVVSAGGSVAFPNHDPFRHNVFSKSGPGEFDLGLYARGETRQAKISKPGVYPIFCNIHARMVAFIVAVRTAHVTQAGADGRFSISDVPAGNYTLRVWHDRGGSTKQDVNVGAEGLAGLTLQLDARNYRYVQHKNKFGQDYPPDGRDRY